jgi:hypothetical protein
MNCVPIQITDLDTNTRFICQSNSGNKFKNNGGLKIYLQTFVNQV